MVVVAMIVALGTSPPFGTVGFGYGSVVHGEASRWIVDSDGVVLVQTVWHSVGGVRVQY